MSKNRNLVDIVGQSANTGEALVAQSDGSFDFSEPSVDFTGLSGYTISADADPATDTNPDAVGALWLREDTNQLYICMDATADANVWKALTFDEDPYVPKFQGTNYGYSSGQIFDTTIDKFSFTSDGNATDVGDLTAARNYTAGQSSQNYGYTTAGQVPVPTVGVVIDKFPFSTDGNATDVGDLTEARFGAAGNSSISNGYGYTSGGWKQPGYSDTIDKFSFSSDGNATDAGNVSISRYKSTGQSSSDYGYNTGGSNPSYTYTKTRSYKFPFSSSFSYTSSVGDLTVGREFPMGQSSETYGYTSGGSTPSASNVIDKFPFSSDANATDVGDLTLTRWQGAGQSSETYGYTTGGSSPGTTNVIDKFSFTSDGNASDVGDLTVGRYGLAGQQY